MADGHGGQKNVLISTRWMNWVLPSTRVSHSECPEARRPKCSYATGPNFEAFEQEDELRLPWASFWEASYSVE